MNRLELLYGRAEIAARVQELADRLNRDYARTNLIVVGVLKGAAIFVADLVRGLDGPVLLDFVEASSYGSGRDSSRRVRITSHLRGSLAGAHVLMVDDILDTGFSARALSRYLGEKRPASLKTCFLIDKAARRQVDFRPDYVGFRLDEGFVVGYGMDHAERYRNLPDLYLLD